MPDARRRHSTCLLSNLARFVVEHVFYRDPDCPGWRPQDSVRAGAEWSCQALAAVLDFAIEGPAICFRTSCGGVARRVICGRPDVLHKPAKPLRNLETMPSGNPDPYLVPAFSLRNRLLRAGWGFVYTVLFRTSPRPLHRWRAFLLRCFGAKLGRNVHIY